MRDAGVVRADMDVKEFDILAVRAECIGDDCFVFSVVERAGTVGDRSSDFGSYERAMQERLLECRDLADRVV